MRARRIASRAAAALMLVMIFCGGVDARSADSPDQRPHAGHDHQHSADQPPAPVPQLPPVHHDHPADEQPARGLPSFIPPVTDEDRKAAFPDVAGHATHDNALHSFVLFDQLEWRQDGAVNVDTRGWIGRDRDRAWFRAEAGGESGTVDDAQIQLFYGRQFSRWWDVVAGIRQDFRPGPAQTWAAVGIQGLAPQWFEVEATAYVGAGGRMHLRFEVEYELLLTNRLMLQPLVEADLFSQSDPARGVGTGLSTTEAGLRLRYEFRRELAPYVGVVWNTKWGRTADLAEAAGEDTRGARLVAGLRFWF